MSGTVDRVELPTGIRTMVPGIRILNLVNLANRVPNGSFVECGVWRGGCLALLAEIASKSKFSREVWGFDSFEGLPEQTGSDLGHGAEFEGSCRATIDEVVETFNLWNVSMDQVRLVEGWFSETLPVKATEINEISLLRLDGDWYDSTKVCLHYLYPKVVKNGAIIVDDYNTWEGCKVAVDEYRMEHSITDELMFTDVGGEAWWIKS